MKKNLKMIQPKSAKFLGLALALTLCTLFLFQNCSDTGEEKKDNTSFGADNSPFPFDTVIDTISYMSCSGMGNNANPRAYYTFRAGAYQTNSGIGVNANFLSQVTGASQRVDAIQNSPSNLGSSIQLAVRAPNDFQTVLGSNGGAQDGVHYYNILDALSAPVIADRLGQITNAGYKVNYFGGVAGLGNRLVEGSIRFFDGENQSAQVRNWMSNSSYPLTVTYSMPGASQGWIARAPDITNNAKVYGRSYQMSFKNWGSSAAGLNRLVSSVIERDILAGSNAVATWTCAETSSYVIVRAQDSGYCSAAPDPRNPSAADRVRLEKLRRVLRVEDWWVDLARGCVIPKNSPTGGGGSCYGAQTTIAYTVGVPGSGVTTCDATNCPHYVTVCTRN